MKTMVMATELPTIALCKINQPSGLLPPRGAVLAACKATTGGEFIQVHWDSPLSILQQAYTYEERLMYLWRWMSRKVPSMSMKTMSAGEFDQAYTVFGRFDGSHLELDAGGSEVIAEIEAEHFAAQLAAAR